MTALGYMAHGGHGCISVVVQRRAEAVRRPDVSGMQGDHATALKMHDKLMPLHDAVFKEPGLAGAKHGLKLLGRIDEKLRLPMMPVTPPTGKVIRNAMVHAGLIN